MDICDDTVLLGPDINEEAQRWIETDNNHKKSRTPAYATQTSLHSTCTRSTNPRSPATPATPPTRHSMPKPHHHQAENNTFEQSFAAAFAHPPQTYDGNADYDDRTPLLESFYNDPQAPTHHHALVQQHVPPLESPGKSKPTRSICLWNGVTHSSQYTRPAAELLREVVEVQHPAASVSARHEQVGEGHRLSDGDERCGRRRWWYKLLRRRVAI
jgi:hypothetical protein